MKCMRWLEYCFAKINFIAKSIKGDSCELVCLFYSHSEIIMINIIKVTKTIMNIKVATSSS